MKKLSETPNDRLRRGIQACLDQKQTLRQIADRAGLKSYQILQHILKGDTEIPREIIPLSYAIGSTPEEIWFGEGKRSPYDPEILQLIDRFRTLSSDESASVRVTRKGNGGHNG